MRREKLTFRLRVLTVYSMILAIGLPVVPLAQGAEQWIDLDGDPSNGAESRVVTRVLSTFPVEIENVVYNNADGKAFAFIWRGAGPGGFSSSTTAGPGVGTKWEWSTVSQVYSIQSPASFSPQRGIAVVGGQPQGLQIVASGTEFVVPGKSIFPTDVTLSSASLTSSLITFFSPPDIIGECSSRGEFGPTLRILKNPTNETQTFNDRQEGCCFEPDQTICNGECKSFLTDPDNCGDCDIQCAFDEVCNQGSCEPICPEGEILCGETCVDPLTDPENCGDCDVACAFDEFCDLGTCEPICPEGETLCGEQCVNLQNDPDNCGACDFPCDNLFRCADGVCEPDCPPGQTLCLEIEACVDLQTDPANCGACGNACFPEQLCSSGACVCPTGETLCGTDCVDLLTDPANCGTCGNQCPPVQFCSGGSCVCPNGGTLCGDQCVDLQTDPANCGTCGNACFPEQLCSSGACVCPTGETLCGTDCVDLLADPANCGTCGNQCPPETFCSTGTCACTDPALTLCGDTCVDLQTDPDNCGACGAACAADEFCENATCLPICPEGFTLCGTQCVDITTDENNCGGCGNVCPGPDAICIPDCSTPPDCSGICLQCQGNECPTGTGSADSSLQSSFPAPRERRPATRPTVRTDRTTQEAASSSTSVNENRALRSPLRKGDAVLESRSDVVSGGRGTRARRPALQSRVDETNAPAPAVDTSTSARAVAAPLCSLESVEVVLQPGEEYVECLDGSIVGKEVFTRSSVKRNGKLIGSGPCAQIVPDMEAVIPAFLPSPTNVIVTSDDSGDLLPQPGENVCVRAEVVNAGTADYLGSATLSSPPDAFNPLPLTFSSATSAFELIPPSIPGTCDTPAQLFPKTSLDEYCFGIPSEQEPDVGRVFRLTWSNGTDTPVEMTFVLGIGDVCDPATDLDGETYDTLTGLDSPVNARLVPEGDPVNISRRRFNVGSTIPMKLSLACGSQVLGADDLDLFPTIVGLREVVFGPQSLNGINGDNNANPDDPQFSCSSTGCDYQFRTEQLVPGTYIVSIEMPDSRVFEAGFELRP